MEQIRTVSLPPAAESIRLEAHDGFEDGVGLGEDGVFEDGLVGDKINTSNLLTVATPESPLQGQSCAS